MIYERAFRTLGKASRCMMWSVVLSVPLWVCTLMIVRAVIVPEVHVMASQWEGDADAVPAHAYAHLEHDSAIHAIRHDAHVLAKDVRRWI